MMKRPIRKSEIRFAFFGTPGLAAAFLDDLERDGLVPSLVVTAPDSSRGRGLRVAATPVKEWARAREIPVLQPEDFDEGTVAELQKERYEIFIVIYYGKILPRKAFSLPPRGTINVHFSLLPRWKGTSPVRAAILHDDKKIGTSLVLMDEQVDHGPLIAQKELALGEWPPSARQAEALATRESAKLLGTMLIPWIEGSIEARPQNHDLETLCPTYAKKDGLIDLGADPYENLLKIRGFDSTIGTYTLFERAGKKVRVQILDAHLDGKKLAVDRVKPEGKREMSYADFLRSGAVPLATAELRR